MRGTINGYEVEADEQFIAFEYWGGMDEDDVPDQVVYALDEHADGWRNRSPERDPLYVYIADDESWVSTESVHELELSA